MCGVFYVNYFDGFSTIFGVANIKFGLDVSIGHNLKKGN